MPIDILKLTKILQIEAKNGYRDEIVSGGGIAAFIGNWTSASLKANPSPAEARLIEYASNHLTDYAELAPDQRATAIQDILHAAQLLNKPTASSLNNGKAAYPSRQTFAPSTNANPVAPLNTATITDSSFSANKKKSTTTKPATKPSQLKTPIKPPEQETYPAQATVTATPNPTLKKELNAPKVTSKADHSQAVSTNVSSSIVHHFMNQPITIVKGIGTSYAELLEKVSIKTIEDALYYFPFRHEDYSSFKKVSELMYGRTESVMVKVIEVQAIRIGRNSRELIEVTFGDETGTLRATYFSRKQIYSLKPGVSVVVSGKVESVNGKIGFRSPSHELAEKDLIHTGRFVPVYHTSLPLKVTTLRSMLKKCLDAYVQAVPEHLPMLIRQQHQLIELATAIKDFHFPADKNSLERARRRLAFDEFFMIQLGLLSKRREWQEEQPAPPFRVEPALLESWYASMPFALTGDQKNAIADIFSDIAKLKPMRRLVQGDVGSGKTMVAATALLATVANGYQGVMMAPTQILAEQHYKNLSRIYDQFGEKNPQYQAPRVALLSSAVKKKNKELTYQLIASGAIDVVVGTNAIIQEGVQFNRLGLVITDEQHRFGVMQRAELRGKGESFNPHVLTMTATPIPRSLSLTVYGDLDLSIIREMPPGRKPIKTKWVLPNDRAKAYDFIRTQIQKGRQAFIICPLVEESEKIEAKSAIEEHQRLQTAIFPDLKLGLLHGRMKPVEKDQIMLNFREKKIDILVATSVIEVGIDIPNASVIMIEGADHFGLSQLHQFRGRVGRGDHASFCLLLASDDLSQVGQKRLRIIEETSDGFILAEEDLKMRGPGEFFGTKQSGVPNLRVAGVYDTPLLEIARESATQIFQKDPTLEKHPLLAQKLQKLWQAPADVS